MSDTTETIRRGLVAELTTQVGSREYLEQKHGQVWTTQELQQDFDALGFMAPFVIVRRRSDGSKGSLTFQHHPRFYFGWQAE